MLCLWQSVATVIVGLTFSDLSAFRCCLIFAAQHGAVAARVPHASYGVVAEITQDFNNERPAKLQTQVVANIYCPVVRPSSLVSKWRVF